MDAHDVTDGAIDTLVVYCHPYEGSLCHAVLLAACRGLEAAGRSYRVVDLYEDGFDPALRAVDLATYMRGTSSDPLVARYQDLLGRSRHLVLVAPIWWNDLPAMLKGWVDKVMLVGFSWEATGHGLHGTLGDRVRSVDLLSTSAAPTAQLEPAVRPCVLEATFAQLGIPERRWHNFGGMDQSTQAQREAWLGRVERLMARGDGC